jgi:uncharacterized protein (DUF58 family)
VSPARSPAPAWRPTWTARRAGTLLVLTGSAALVLGRPVLALLVLPLAVGVATAWASRTGELSPAMRVETPALAEQGGVSEAAVTLTGVRHSDLAVVRLPASRGEGQVIVVGSASGDGGDLRLTVPIDTAAWGRHQLGGGALRLATADGMYASQLVAAPEVGIRVLPPVRPLPAAELPARTTGQVGAHRTRRPGDGSELLDVREFRIGDRIRRIDWRVSARREELHVRHTAIDSDADLVICVDTRFDLGPQVSGWADRTRWAQGQERACLETSITAALTLAGTYLRLGDRVGLVDLTVPYRGVPPGSGVRQLMRIRWQLAGVVPDSQLRRRRFDGGSLPTGAVVVVLSPFVDDQIDEVMGALARMRRDVIAVDVLPSPLELPSDRAELAAARLILAERRERLELLRRRGVVVTPWDPALLGQLLRRRQRARRWP